MLIYIYKLLKEITNIILYKSNTSIMDYYDNRFHPADSNDVENVSNHDKELDRLKSLDSGYNKFYRFEERIDGSMKKIKVEFYTSGLVGTRIRDAESGIFKNENSSNTVFFQSPNHYMKLFGEELSDEIVNAWEEKRAYREHQLSQQPRKSCVYVK